ncbi:hypothetical protein PHAVU_007G182700 [Phaseolus vulgaris]|uniref:Uncharacterized protein n=1 Tax=Phaseolus vulgaris TaxID=3885 RepID=V7BIG8_PHAVU|nr:hypothetical protein PHAVU_007G182700g [Phaseolus vulgaris]ESW16758.1 hypothetical protein PHAVU_007G182700g [Phaseolus vulgaris]
MNLREFNLQPMAFCCRLYNFLKRALTLQASKTVTLGRSRHDSSSSTALSSSDSKEKKEVQSETPSEVDDGKKLPPTEGVVGDSVSSHVQQAEEKNNSCMNIDDKKEGKNEVLTSATPTSTLAPTRSIKKTVSINENVEEIRPPNKLKRIWSKSFQKIGSRDEEEEPMPPPRPILKLASDLTDKSYSCS